MKKHNLLKVLALCTALVLLSGVLLFANAMVGNPISAYLAGRTAAQCVARDHPGSDYVTDRAAYSFKDGNYWVHARSPSSPDSSFTLWLDWRGVLIGDDYEYRVTGRGNTADRLDEQYRDAIRTVLGGERFPYETEICFGTFFAAYDFGDGAAPDEPVPGTPVQRLDVRKLELDRAYDIGELSTRYGEVTLYVAAEEAAISPETAAKVLMDTRAILTDSGLAFHSMQLSLIGPKLESGQDRNELDIMNFPWDGIYEEGLGERVEQAARDTREYHDAMDRERKEAAD